MLFIVCSRTCSQTAMEKKLRTIRLATAAGHALPWIETMTLTYDKSHEGVVDSHQDLQRELGFYTQAKDALDKVRTRSRSSGWRS